MQDASGDTSSGGFTCFMLQTVSAQVKTVCDEAETVERFFVHLVLHCGRLASGDKASPLLPVPLLLSNLIIIFFA